MKIWYIFFLIALCLFTCGSADDVKDIYISAAYQPSVERLEQIFKETIAPSNSVIYTKVPRGLIISVDEKYLFHQGEAKIKLNCICLLDTIAEILRTLPNDCVVENHTEHNDLSKSDFESDWELSVGRSCNIVQYMIQYGHIAPKRLFAMGYGQFMPFADNVAPKKGMNDRIDFVILEYEAKR